MYWLLRFLGVTPKEELNIGYAPDDAFDEED